jgi:hypothetical protein
MAYTIYKTNGQQLLTLLDGTLDSSRGINLVGKNYVNFGTAQNENFVWLLENHANDTPPTYPVTGQLWYDTSTSTLKYFDGSTFSILANAVGVASNVASLTNALTANVANLSSYFSSNIATLTSNAASQDTQITSLWANAAIQASMLNSLSGVVTGSNVDISAMLDSTNSRIDATNSDVSALNSSLNTQISRIDTVTDSVSDLNDLLAAQAVVQSTHGGQISALQSGLTSANSSISSANVAMRSYVDATNGTQTTQINSLSTSVNTLQASFTSFYSWANLNFGTSNYTNSDVALYLPTYTGNIGASTITISAGIKWSNGQPYSSGSADYGNANVAQYLASGVTTGNIVAENIQITGNLNYTNVNYDNVTIAGNIIAKNYLYDGTGPVTISSSNDLNLEATGWITLSSAPKLPTYTRPQLVSYTNPPTGGIAFYSNVGVPVYYDGANWKFFSNNTTI